MQHAIGTPRHEAGPDRRLIIRQMSDSVAAEITVAVRFGGRLGAGRRSIRLPAGATVAVLLIALTAETEEPTTTGLTAAAVAVGGDVVGRDHVLHDGDAVALVLPVAGG